MVSLHINHMWPFERFKLVQVMHRSSHVSDRLDASFITILQPQWINETNTCSLWKTLLWIRRKWQGALRIKLGLIFVLNCHAYEESTCHIVINIVKTVNIQFKHKWLYFQQTEKEVKMRKLTNWNSCRHLNWIYQAHSPLMIL